MCIHTCTCRYKFAYLYAYMQKHTCTNMTYTIKLPDLNFKIASLYNPMYNGATI